MRFSTAFAVCLFGVSFLAASVGVAAEQVNPAMQARITIKKEFSAEMKAISALAKESKTDLAAMASHAKKLSQLAVDYQTAFEKNEKRPEDAAIWAQWSDFSSKLQAFKKDADALAAAGEAGDVKGAMAAYEPLSASCKGCHSVHRPEK